VLDGEPGSFVEGLRVRTLRVVRCGAPSLSGRLSITARGAEQFGIEPIRRRVQFVELLLELLPEVLQLLGIEVAVAAGEVPVDLQESVIVRGLGVRA